MAYTATVIPVMIASPSDVAVEREIAREILTGWNFAHSAARRAVLMPVGWETHSAPEVGTDTAQGLINARLLEDCDLLVAIFWTRLGTPTGAAASGSVEEVERHIAVGKPALVYFSDKLVAPQMLDHAQYAALQEFKTWCQDRGLVQPFESEEDFRRKFARHLDITLHQNPMLKAIIVSSPETELAPRTVERSLSVEASRLLRSAAEDPHGMLGQQKYMGGASIFAGRESIYDGQDRRTLALWEGAFDELVEFGLIEDLGYEKERFHITARGYGVIDKNKKPDDGGEVEPQTEE